MALSITKRASNTILPVFGDMVQRLHVHKTENLLNTLTLVMEFGEVKIAGRVHSSGIVSICD